MDGLSLFFREEVNKWDTIQYLGLKGTYFVASGEVEEDRFFARYKGLHLLVKSGSNGFVHSFRGSIPKFFNGGISNGFDFTFSDFQKSINLLKKELNLKPDKGVLKSFEFGVLIDIPFDINYFQRCLLTFKRKAYTPYEKNGRLIGFCFKLQQYHFKLYFKNLQEGRGGFNQLRVEVAIKKMIFINRKGFRVKFLSDLSNKIVWRELSDLLIKCWNETIFFDSEKFNVSSMNERERLCLLNFSSSNFWNNLNDKNFYKAKQKLHSLENVYQGSDNMKIEITRLIKEKIDHLIGDDLTYSFGGIEREELTNITIFEKGDELTILKKDDMGGNIHIDKGIINKHIEDSRICMLDGCDSSLSGKRKGAKYCSDKCRKKNNDKGRVR